MQDLEQSQTVRIVGAALTTSDGWRGCQLRFSGAEQRSDEHIEFRRFLVEVEDRSQGAGLVTQSVHPILARAPDQVVQPFLDLGSAERASHDPAARAGRAHVLQEGTRRGTQEEIAEKGQVGGERRQSASKSGCTSDF